MPTTLQTPLMWAAIHGHALVATRLLGHGAAPDAQDSLGASPSVLAVQHGAHLALLALADAGADLRAGDVRGCGPAHWAAYRGDVTALRILRKMRVPLIGAEARDGVYIACNRDVASDLYYVWVCRGRLRASAPGGAGCGAGRGPLPHRGVRRGPHCEGSAAAGRRGCGVTPAPAAAVAFSGR